MSDKQSSLPPDRLWQPTTAKWFIVVFGGSLAYAVVRYHFAGDVAWQHFPLFILNKATSLAAVIFVACSYLIGKIIRWHDHDGPLRLVVIKFCGLTGFFLAAVHAFFSLALLSPAYYGKYFDGDGRLNLEGEIAISVGVLALFFLLVAGSDDVADDAQGNRGLAMEAEPTSRLHCPDPGCGPPGGPGCKGLVGTTGMEWRDPAGELGRCGSGTGAAARQAQAGAREARAGGAPPGQVR